MLCVTFLSDDILTFIRLHGTSFNSVFLLVPRPLFIRSYDSYSKSIAIFKVIQTSPLGHTLIPSLNITKIRRTVRWHWSLDVRYLGPGINLRRISLLLPLGPCLGYQN